MQSGLLTTGEAAKLCGVTSDAVLKWIKKGRLRAIRTTGGHFRIARENLESLGYFGPGAPGPDDLTTPLRSTQLPKRCWEHFCRNVALPDACTKCVVYRARIEKCYEVSELGETIGHSRRFCRVSCDECSFYRACKGLASAVLVVTSDEALIGRLTTQANTESVLLRFARSGYESSMLIETFHPSVIVMDTALPEVRDGRLVDSMSKDERLLGVKLVVALRRGDRVTPGPDTAVMPAPFTVKKIERFLQALEQPADAGKNMAS